MATGHKRLTHCECDFFTMNRCETEVIFNFNFRRYKSWHRLKVYFRLAAFCWPCCTVGTVRSKFAFAFKWQSTRNVVAIYFEVYILCAHFMLICTFSPFSIVYAACCIGSKLASELNAKTMPLFVCSIFGQIIKMKWKLLSIWCWTVHNADNVYVPNPHNHQLRIYGKFANLNIGLYARHTHTHATATLDIDQWPDVALIVMDIFIQIV